MPSKQCTQRHSLVIMKMKEISKKCSKIWENIFLLIWRRYIRYINLYLNPYIRDSGSVVKAFQKNWNIPVWVLLDVRPGLETQLCYEDSCGLCARTKIKNAVNNIGLLNICTLLDKSPMVAMGQQSSWQKINRKLKTSNSTLGNTTVNDLLQRIKENNS